jgi:hypothetical protein
LLEKDVAGRAVLVAALHIAVDLEGQRSLAV